MLSINKDMPATSFSMICGKKILVLSRESGVTGSRMVKHLIENTKVCTCKMSRSMPILSSNNLVALVTA
jgi:hypothetical protein